MINFSFDSKLFGFAKCGKVGYISVNKKKVFVVAGSTYLISMFGREFTNQVNHDH